ncbi:hypothetical protein BGW37DRAFT_548948 [Umbelopsis sp. PMI_123]|nr:hypothetical protein BGW37DRAFT_548948 [Umbelopsis sp. PMI_123]
MSPKTQGRNIIVAGASGNVGSHILSALLATGLHTISVISRPDSTAEFPANISVHRGSYTDQAFLTAALDKQDTQLIYAAAKAGVPYIIPTKYGLDTGNRNVIAEFPMLGGKVMYRKLIEELGVSSWIGIITNPYLEYPFRTKELCIDIPNRKATVWDAGTTKIPFSTLPMTGKSVAGLLSLPENELAKHKNKFVYSRDIIASAARATGTREEDWTVENLKLDDVLVATREAFARVDGTKHSPLLDAVLHLIAFKDGFGGDYQSKVDYQTLGVEHQRLDDVMKEVAKGLDEDFRLKCK